MINNTSMPLCFISCQGKGLHLVCLLLSVLISTSAHAHKVNMFAYVEGNKVLIEGYFADGHKPNNSDVVVSDASGNEMLRGKTDRDGKFSFDITKITDLHIVLNTDMGHRATYDISREELEGVTTNGEGGAQVNPVSISERNAPAATTENTNDQPSLESLNISEAKLRTEISRANAPLIRAMEEMKSGVNFGNIIGGIGFIAGILGVSFYLMARNRLKQNEQRNSTSS